LERQENHSISRAALAKALGRSGRQVRKAIDVLRDKRIHVCPCGVYARQFMFSIATFSVVMLLYIIYIRPRGAEEMIGSVHCLISFYVIIDVLFGYYL
jgi:hypothetical protein